MDKWHEHHHQRPLHIIGLLIALMGLVAVFFSVTVHDIPRAINDTLFALLNITQSNLDNLHADYQYYLIACMVIAGLVVDLIGPRKVLALSIAVMIIANYFFIQSGQNSLMLNCHLIINICHVFIVIAALTLGTHWLPRRHFSLYVGLLFGILVMAPMCIFSFFQNIYSLFYLQRTVWVINTSGILLIFLMLMTKGFTDRTRYLDTFRGHFEPLSYYKVWLIGLVAMLGWICNAISLAFGTFYLIKHYNIGTDNATDILNTAAIYFGIGAILMGVLSDFVDKRRYLLSIGYALAAFCFSVLIFVPILSYLAASTMLFLTAFFTSSLIICYRKTMDYCTIGNSGITMGFVFSISIIGGILASQEMSSFLQDHYNAAMSANASSWQGVLLVVPVLLSLGAIISIVFIRPLRIKSSVFLPVNKK